MCAYYSALFQLQKLLFCPQCRFCGLEIKGPGRICNSCRKEIFSSCLGGSNFVFIYQGAVLGLMHDLRQREGWQTNQFILKILQRKKILDSWRAQFDYIVLAPSSRKNGMDDLVQDLSQAIQTPYLACLKKKKRTQHNKNAQQRMDASCFVYLSGAPNLSAKKILLLDDVLTTGTTLEMSAYELRKAGAMVKKMALARKMPPGFGRESQDSHQKGDKIHPLFFHFAM